MKRLKEYATEDMIVFSVYRRKMEEHLEINGRLNNECVEQTTNWMLKKKQVARIKYIGVDKGCVTHDCEIRVVSTLQRIYLT